MSERPTGKEIRTLQQNRTFVQFGGARPNNPALYYGLDTNYSIVQNVTRPINGNVTPHWTGDPRVAGKYRLVARTVAAPPLPGFTLTLLEKRKTLNRMFKEDCGFTVYLDSSDCGDLSDFLYGWTDKVEVYADGILQVVNGGNRSDWATDNPIMNQVPAVARAIYEVGSMGFGSVAGSDIAVEVVDICYGTVQRCAGCGQANDGTQWIYAIQKHTGSNEASVLYSTDGGTTWTVIDIGSMTSTYDPVAIDVVGNYLVVVSTAADLAYYYATINNATGVPGSFTKVTTGFVASHAPTDLVSYSDRETYFSGNGGYIYKSTDITAGVSVLTAGGSTTENLGRIAGSGDTIVAVGANATVLISLNRGVSWSVANDAPGAGTLQGVDVRDSSRYWVCDNAGALYYTLDGGNNWVSKALSDSPTDLRDVVFLNDEVGWVVGATTTPTGLVFSTWNGGRDWTSNGAAPRMLGIPTTGFQRGDRVAVPSAGNETLGANAAAIAGLGATTDGIILVGLANFF